ncbi:MAG: Dam family site-specific DNA-(adenine-N6)-methyltransferase [Bacteroidales bacterium]|nr:Dam family site-specific DNA-(adenine-N6)-methyltransferase [Bacteroidales bacterium]
MKESKKKSEAKPFLKWAGGKRQILDHITAAIAPALSVEGTIAYAEPFVGSGAVLFEVLRRYPQKINKAYINDVNADLITTWRAVRDKPYDLIERLQFLKANYLAASQEKQKILFGEARERFNQRDNTDIDQAALLVFLNKTCFNGLYRVNSHNRFNVPHGRYKSPAIVDEEALLAASEILQEVEILNRDYEAMLSAVKKSSM